MKNIFFILLACFIHAQVFSQINLFDLSQEDYNNLTNRPTLVTTLGGLTDVTITGASNGQVLKYNGSAWVNDTDATGGGGGTSSIDLSQSLNKPSIYPVKIPIEFWYFESDLILSFILFAKEIFTLIPFSLLLNCSFDRAPSWFGISIN